MRKTIFYLVAAALIAPVFSSCNDEVTPTPTPTNNDTTDTTDTTTNTPTNTELLMRNWLVSEAYVNGSTPDQSSEGLKVEFKANNAYTLFLKNGSTFDGTWEFIENETKIDIDKSGQYPQTWTIEELSETTLDVTFISPFTQQNAHWIMK